MFLSWVLVSLLLGLVPQTNSYLVMEEPASRNVMWRRGFAVPYHPHDDNLRCIHSQRTPCPPCGDKYEEPRPRPHELGGRWGSGTIVKSYTMGQRIQVQVNITESHGGKLRFNLCPDVYPNTPVQQRCFDKYPLDIVGHRGKVMQVTAPRNSRDIVIVEVKLPYITCDHCVLQVTNTAREYQQRNVMYRNCADIAIKGTAKTSMAGGSPLNQPPSPFDLHTRSGFGGYEEQLQYRFFN